MALVITNGQYYILHNEHGGIKKTQELEAAENFPSVYKASRVIKSAPGRTHNYYVYDTDNKKVCWQMKKRKKYSQTTRKMIYNRSGKRCELCGREIAFSEMTIDHIIPLVMGGTDTAENVQCTCKSCNNFKGSILPDDFMDRITEIFLYQMEKKHRDELAWKCIKRYLKKNL